MALSAQNWNKARINASQTPQRTTTANSASEPGLTLAKYEFDPEYEANNGGEEQPDIEQYQPVWLWHPRNYFNGDVDFDIKSDNKIMRVYGWDRIDGFGDGSDEILDWVVIGVARHRIRPGEIGTFVIDGTTPAKIYDQRITDHSVHQHRRRQYYTVIADIFDYYPSDPATVALENGMFTPYPRGGASTGIPLRARLIWRNVTQDVLSTDENYDPESYDYGIVSLPIFITQ